MEWGFEAPDHEIKHGGVSMPRGDQTGPNGAGPMTGRQMGTCAGYQRPGFANLRRGFYASGRGINAGGGRGFRRNGYVNQPIMPRYVARTGEEETLDLEDEIAYLEQQLATAKARKSGLNE